LRALLEAGVNGDSILVLAPQRSLLKPFQDELRAADLPPGGQVETLTIGGLARRSVDLAWPVIAEAAGFAHPDRPPIFLTLETAQYHLQRVVEPLIVERLYFDDLLLPRHRLYAQLLDGLNKAALVGFPHTDIGRRLAAAWSGKESRARMFAQVQDCVNRFRDYCLDQNLVDFSLQIELLARHLLRADWFRAYLFGRWRHLIVDNVEEDTPVTHDLLREWLPRAESAMICYDADAGYRSFLGADPVSAWELSELCDRTVKLVDSHVASVDVRALEYALEHALSAPGSVRRRTQGDARRALEFGGGRFHPEMLDWVAQHIDAAVRAEGIPPGEIVVLTPFLSDALRFALTERLSRRGIPTRSLRPSRALIDEPAARGLLTLSELAHRDWRIVPPKQDVAHALALSIDGLDRARAHLLAERAYHVADGAPSLRSFDQLKPDLQDRIGYDIGARFDRLREWLSEYGAHPAATFDHFLSRLFGEVLSQPGYGFHTAAPRERGAARLDRGRITAQLIESARKFRRVVAPDPFDAADALSIDKPYLAMVAEGVIAATYVEPPADQPQAVLLAPAYTFLLSNIPATIQVWLNAGQAAWWERLYQPLTHPYVLSRRWDVERKWADEDEQAARRDTLLRLVRGLLRRCRSKVVLAYSSLNEQGYEERGPLLTLIQQVLREN
ncbi:MAG TPA: hypothetical protein VJ754_09105, partial [Anaerolineae bacterium]|nr:hypothetical protein [Anaerolineae bacterium]